LKDAERRKQVLIVGPTQRAGKDRDAPESDGRRLEEGCQKQPFAFQALTSGAYWAAETAAW